MPLQSWRSWTLECPPEEIVPKDPVEQAIEKAIKELNGS